MKYRKLSSADRNGSRLDKLKTLAAKLARMIDGSSEDEEISKQLSSLVKQYRETIKEIENIEGTQEDDDEISEIITEREATGKPGAVRKNRA